MSTARPKNKYTPVLSKQVYIDYGLTTSLPKEVPELPRPKYILASSTSRDDSQGTPRKPLRPETVPKLSPTKVQLQSLAALKKQPASPRKAIEKKPTSAIDDRLAKGPYAAQLFIRPVQSKTRASLPKNVSPLTPTFRDKTFVPRLSIKKPNP